MSPIVTYISDVLSREFEVPPDLLTPDTAFEDMSFDSLVLLELAVIVEREHGVIVDEGEIEITHTISEAADVLSAKGLEL